MHPPQQMETRGQAGGPRHLSDGVTVSDLVLEPGHFSVSPSLTTKSPSLPPEQLCAPLPASEAPELSTVCACLTLGSCQRPGRAREASQLPAGSLPGQAPSCASLVVPLWPGIQALSSAPQMDAH